MRIRKIATTEIENSHSTNTNKIQKSTNSDGSHSSLSLSLAHKQTHTESLVVVHIVEYYILYTQTYKYEEIRILGNSICYTILAVFLFE